jgi:HEAT repeat protein
MLRTWRCMRNTSPPVLVAAVLLGLCLGTHSDAQTYRDRNAGEWIEILKSEDVRQRWYATLALARIGPGARDAIPPLMSLLEERSQYEYVRAGAALALGSIHEDPQRVVPLLAETLESDLASVRRHSARALGRFGSQAEPAVPRMLAQLRRDDLIFRIDLAEALWYVAKHERAVPFLVEQVQTGNTPGGFEAAEALGRVGAENADLAIPALVEALGSTNADITRSAAKSLGRLGPAVLPRLAGAASSEPVNVRRNAIEAYSWMGPAGASGLVGALSDPAPVVRRAAARGLGRLGPQVAAVEPALLRAVNDSDPHVRTTAAAALKQIGRVLP